MGRAQAWRILLGSPVDLSWMDAVKTTGQSAGKLVVENGVWTVGEVWAGKEVGGERRL